MSKSFFETTFGTSSEPATRLSVSSRTPLWCRRRAPSGKVIFDGPVNSVEQTVPPDGEQSEGVGARKSHPRHHDRIGEKFGYVDGSVLDGTVGDGPARCKCLFGT